MVTPERMKVTLCQRGIADKYSFERPIPMHAPLPIEALPAVADFVGRGARNFKTSYARRAKNLLHGKGYLTTITDASSHRSTRYITRALFHNNDGIQAYGQIEPYVRSLLHNKSFGLVENGIRNIDIVNDVLNLAPIHWIADEIGLPLKTGERPHGVIFEQQADEAFKSIFSCVTLSFCDSSFNAARYIFMENDAAIINQLEDTAKRHVRMLQYHLRTHVHSINSGVRVSTSTLLLLTSRRRPGTRLDGPKTCSGHLRLATNPVNTIFTRSLRGPA
jgi:linoleate 10R-lipoxygenase